MLNLEDLERGSVVAALSDDQLTGVVDGDGVWRSKSVVLGQQVTYEASGECPLRHAVIVAVRHDHRPIAVDAQTTWKLEQTCTGALRADLPHELTATVEYLHILLPTKLSLYVRSLQV